jgi:MFS family permease
MADQTATATTPGFERKQTRTNYRVVLAIVLFITLLVSYLDRTNISVLIADDGYLRDLDIFDNTTRQGLLLTVFLLAYGVANIVLAPIGNVMGPRKAMMLAIAIWCVSCIWGGLAGTFGIMLAARVLLGAGEGVH